MKFQVKAIMSLQEPEVEDQEAEVVEVLSQVVELLTLKEACVPEVSRLGALSIEPGEARSFGIECVYESEDNMDPQFLDDEFRAFAEGCGVIVHSLECKEVE